MKEKLLILNLDKEELCFGIIGITSSEKESYRFACITNKNCNFGFRRIKDHLIIDKEKSFYFQTYFFYYPKIKQEIFLISNYSIPITIEDYSLFSKSHLIKTLIPEYKTFNYLLITNYYFNNDIYLDLQKVKIINTLYKIDSNSINKNNLNNLIIEK